MGRYYEGDIEGKFAFGIQSSSAADRFGVTGEPPNYLEYYFDEDNVNKLREELNDIHKSLGEYGDLIKIYCELLYHNIDSPHYTGLRSYIEKANMKPPTCESVWSDMYDYILGKKILDCILEKGECNFIAEL